MLNTKKEYLTTTLSTSCCAPQELQEHLHSALKNTLHATHKKNFHSMVKKLFIVTWNYVPNKKEINLKPRYQNHFCIV